MSKNPRGRFFGFAPTAFAIVLSSGLCLVLIQNSAHAAGKRRHRQAPTPVASSVPQPAPSLAPAPTPVQQDLTQLPQVPAGALPGNRADTQQARAALEILNRQPKISNSNQTYFTDQTSELEKRDVQALLSEASICGVGLSWAGYNMQRCMDSVFVEQFRYEIFQDQVISVTDGLVFLDVKKIEDTEANAGQQRIRGYLVATHITGSGDAVQIAESVVYPLSSDQIEHFNNGYGYEAIQRSYIRSQLTPLAQYSLAAPDSATDLKTVQENDEIRKVYYALSRALTLESHESIRSAALDAFIARSPSLMVNLSVNYETALFGIINSINSDQKAVKISLYQILLSSEHSITQMRAAIALAELGETSAQIKQLLKDAVSNSELNTRALTAFQSLIDSDEDRAFVISLLASTNYSLRNVAGEIVSTFRLNDQDLNSLAAVLRPGASQDTVDAVITQLTRDASPRSTSILIPLLNSTNYSRTNILKTALLERTLTNTEVAQLSQVARQTTYDYALNAMIELIGKVKTTESVTAIAAIAQGHDSSLSAAAVSALAANPSIESTLALIPFLSSSYYASQAQTFQILETRISSIAVQSDTRVISTLQSVGVASRSDNGKIFVLGILKTINTAQAVPAITAIAANTGAYIRTGALNALIANTTTAATHALILFFKDSDYTVSTAAFTEVSRRHVDPTMIEELAVVVTASQGRSKSYAAQTLGRLPGPASLALLATLLTDTQYEVRQAAVQATALNPSAEATATLIQSLKDREYSVRTQAQAKLSTRTIEASHLTALQQILQESNYAIRLGALHIISRNSSVTATDLLLKSLADTEYSIRDQVHIFLRERTLTAENLPTLLLVSADSKSTTRTLSVTYLVQLSAQPQAIQALGRLATDSDWSVRASAIEALKLVRTVESSHALIGVLSIANLDHINVATAELMLRTLNEAQIALVIESLSSRNYTARSAAVSLLGKSSSCVALGALTQRLTVENDYTLTQNIRTAIASVRERTSCTASE